MTGPWHPTLREPRQGIMLHYDGSVTDRGALDWLRHPDCRVSYTYLLWDNGNIHPVAPLDARAWHAGVCRSSGQLSYRDANSAFYGLAIAARPGDVVTQPQLDSLVALCQTLYKREGWSRDETWRLTGHADEVWPRGRKVDPIGPDPRRPVLTVDMVRERL